MTTAKKSKVKKLTVNDLKKIKGGLPLWEMGGNETGDCESSDDGKEKGSKSTGSKDDAVSSTR